MNLTDITGIYEQIDNPIRECTIICCADHGVAEENVSAYPKETTVQMMKNYVNVRGAAANAFSDFVKSELIIVDVGVDADISDLQNIVHRKIARGTNNITKGPAMTMEQAFKAIEIGTNIVMTAFEAGYNCFLPGEMGIANTTSNAAITALILNKTPEEVTGRGTNISDERFKHKIEVVRKAVEINTLTTSKPKYRAMEALMNVGGFETACIVGIIIGARRTKSIVILDGFNTAVAGLIACEMFPECRDILIASHIAREKGQHLILEALNLTPMLNLDLALGEAIGSSIAARILRNLDLNNTRDTDYYYDTEDDDDSDSDGSNDDDDEPEFDFNILGFDIEENDDDNDDENYDIELNIYNGEGVNHRFNNNTEEDEFSFSIKRMSSENISVTDRTFNFYLNTMPSLDKYAMEHCQSHIDNLSKPHGSLGVLEEIVVQCAGISGEELPSSRLKTNLICFTDKKDDADEIDECIQNDEEPDIENPLSDIMDIVESFDVGITFAVIDNKEDSTAVFDFGRMTAEDVSFKVPIIGISILSDISRYEDITEEIREHLLTQDNKLKYEATDFLKHVPKSRRNLISGVIGAIIAAAHNSSLIIVDSGATDIIARYLEKLCPAIRPYILHATKLVVNDKDCEDDELDGEVVCIAIEVIRAALHCINEMKTFKDTGVNAAIDGIGFYHQSN